MIYEKVYQTIDEYTETEGGGVITSVTPGTGYIVENGESKYNTEPDSDIMVMLFEVTNISTPTRIYYSSMIKDGLNACLIDGENVPVSALSATYQFTKPGIHKIFYYFEGRTFLDDNLFRDCTELVYVNIPKTISSLGEACFYNCTNLSTMILNYEGVVSMPAGMDPYFPWGRAFRNALKLQRIKVPAEYVTQYRSQVEYVYGSAIIMPIEKSVKSVDYGIVQTNKRQLKNASIIDYVLDNFSDSDTRYVVPAVTDYIEIDSATTAISFCSSYLYYSSPYGGGAYSTWYLVSFDENKRVLGFRECFHKYDEEATFVLPEGTKYIRYNFLWANVSKTDRSWYQLWAKYAHVMDKDTKEIIWPKIKYE